MKLFRARAWRGRGAVTFDALDSSGSVAGPKGWRFNDRSTEILYTAEVEALAILEVVIRPGLETIRQILVATIEVPDGAIVSTTDLGITLPANWSARPVADDSRTIAREFLDAVGRVPPGRPKPVGLRVPSALSSTDSNVLLDPAHRREYRVSITTRLPFDTFRQASS